MTKVEMLKQTFWGDDANPGRTYRVGEVAEIPDVVAARWFRRGIAIAVSSVPVEPAPAPQTRVPGTRELLGLSDPFKDQEE